MDAGGAIGIYWIYLLAGVVTVIFTGTVIGVVVQTQRRQVEQSRRFSQGLVEAQEAERARIARELHDDVIQRVALIGGEVSALGRMIPEPSELIRQRFEGLREELHDLADEVLFHGDWRAELGAIEFATGDQNSVPQRFRIEPANWKAAV